MKKVEQVNRSGNIVVDYDQILTTKEIKRLLFEMFNPIIKQDGKQFVLYDKIALLACNVFASAGEDAVSHKPVGDLIHAGSFKVFPIGSNPSC